METSDALFASNDTQGATTVSSAGISGQQSGLRVAPQQIASWIVQAAGTGAESDMGANTTSSTTALSMLQQWTTTEDPRIIVATLFQVLGAVGNNSVGDTTNGGPMLVFYALTELGRMSLEPMERAHLRNFLSHYYRQQQPSSTIPAYLRNKVALLLVQSILADGHTDRWTSMETDLLHLSADCPDLFLKTVETLLEEFRYQANATSTFDGDKPANGWAEDDQNKILLVDPEDMRRLKELLKGYHPTIDNPGSPNGEVSLLERLFDRVLSILAASLHSDASMSGSSSTTSILALQTIKSIFVWTELSFLNPSSVNRALELLLVALHPDRESLLLLSALEAWQEWITCTTTTAQDEEELRKQQSLSGFSSQDIKLPAMIALLEKIHELNLLPVAGESQVAEIEVVIEIGNLINTMGLEVIADWESATEDLENESLQTSAVNSPSPIFKLFNEIMDLFFRAFAYDDIDVSAAVLPFVARLTTCMAPRQRSDGTNRPLASATGHLPQILNVLYRQLKYPEDFHYDFEDEDDAEEEVYRAELCKTYTKLVRAAPDMCLQFVGEAATAAQLAVTGGSALTSSLQDVEATLRLIYHYCEGIRPSPGLKVAMRNESFCSLLVALHCSDIRSHTHREVICLYFETAVRYYPIFTKSDENRHLLSKVLEALTGTNGLQHSHPRVRSRCCYLLLRLVKSVTSIMRPYVERAVAGIQGLLSNKSLELRPDDTLYLFECMGVLLGKTGVDAVQQQQYITELLTPHVHSIEKILATPNLGSDPEYYGDLLSSSVSAITHLSKGFSKPVEGVKSVLLETVGVSLRVLEAVPTNESVRSKSMVFLQRMIQCVGEPVLQSVPNFLASLIPHCTTEDVIFVSQIFNQVCIRFKAEACEVLDDFLLPFLNKCQSLVPAAEHDSGSGIPPHLRTEQLSIQKLSFSVLQHIVSHKATAILISSANAGAFESVLQTMRDGAVYVQDPIIKRTCTKFFRELLEQWEPQCSDGETGSRKMFRHGFITFTSERFVPDVFDSMKSSAFNIRDAMQIRVVSEIALILRTFHGMQLYSDLLVPSLCSRITGPTDDIATALLVSSSESDIEKCLLELLKRAKDA